MGDLTRNLSRSEFACKCGCGYDTVDFDLPDVIQDCVDHFQEQSLQANIRVRINSGTRCLKYNTQVGGSPGSQHVEGKAADIAIYNALTGMHIHADEVADYFEATYPTSKGIGRYIGRTHIDVRKARARWDNR